MDETALLSRVAGLVRARMTSRWPELDLRDGAPGAIDVFVAGRAEPIARVGLASVVANVARDPAREAELVDEFLAHLPVAATLAAARGGAALAPLRADAIFPRLVPGERFAEIEDLAARPALREFPVGLRVALVASAPDLGVDRYLTECDLARLDLSWDSALARAHQNLKDALNADPTAHQVAAGPDGRPALWIISHAHASGAVLLSTFPETLGRALGPGFFVCIPAFDEVVALRAFDARFAASVIARAQETFRESAYPVSDRVFRATATGLEPLPAPDR
jgi:hypothetical protein